MFFKKDETLAPSQLNEHGQVTDEKILKKDRLKFGVCTILDRSEESSLGGIPSVLIRSLGGSDFHIGVYSATQGALSFAQFLGALILDRTRSNRKAMIWSMYIGVLLAAAIALSILAGAIPEFKPFALWSYLVLCVGFAGAAGIQLNLETSWIGDLVPCNKLGWFNSYKWILTSIGILLFNLLIGGMADRFPGLGCYASVYLIFGVSFIAAALIYRSCTDRPPKVASFMLPGRGHLERINYSNVPMWCYIVFYWCWSGGRTAMMAFTAVFLIDQFNFSMTKIAWFANVQLLIGMVVLHVLGRITDRSGSSRKALLWMSAIVSSSMLLWVSSAWLGVIPILVYQVISGAAGNTHSMVAINMALETMPEKGRAAYLGFSRLCIGVVVMIAPALAGAVMTRLTDFHTTFAGVVINRYHLLFTVSTLITMCCVIPLWILGRWLAREKRLAAPAPGA